MRARNLKPSLFKNEILGSADPLLTILFEGLWCEADREGRLEDRPLRIKAEIFPYREGLDINALLDWLVLNGFIVRYKANGANLIQVTKFLEHQHPHKNEVASVLQPMAVQSHPLAEVDPPLDVALGLTPSSLTPDSLVLTPDCSALAAPLVAEDSQKARTQAGEMATTLRDLGVRVTSLDQTLMAWLSDGFTVQQVVDATALARMRKPYPEPIPANYLDPILRQAQRPPPQKLGKFERAKAIIGETKDVGFG